MNRGIHKQGRYPAVPQSHQLPATKIPQQPHDLNYVPTSDVKFYNIHSEAQLRTTPSEVWSQSSFPPPVPPEQNHNPLPLPPSTGYWQQPLYSTEPVNVASLHDPWKWTVDNSSQDVNNQYEQPQSNFQVPNTWQQNSTPYQQPSDAQVNNPYIQQPPISSGLAKSAYSSHFAPWHPPSMDQDSHAATNDSQTQSWPDSTTLSNSHSQWQNFNHENSESQNVFWSYGVQQTAQPSQWPSDGFPQHANVGSMLTSNWNDQAESSAVLTDRPSQVDCNQPQGNGDNSVQCSRENVYNSEHNVHDISCKNVDNVDSQSKTDTLEHLEVADNYVAPHDDGANLVRKEIAEEEYKSDSSLSAFFNNDVQDQVSAEENACPEVLSEKNSRDSRSNSVTGCEMELQGPCCAGNPLTANGKSSVTELPGYNVIQENNGFIQNESSGSFAGQVNLESSGSPVGSPEDSPNQEVPEPSPSSNSSSKISSLSSTSQHTKTTLTADLESSHEPPNQQVPQGSEGAVIMPLAECENSIQISQEESSPLNQQVPVITKESVSSSSERDKVVIHAREESPFKPPSKLLNSKGLVVQQEISPLPPVSKSPNVDGMRCDQGVNMETVPDNLERPPDTEEQKMQSSWSTSLHRHHARNHVDSSPSTSLWDSPDIPCVTLVPADPTPLVVHKYEEMQPNLPLVKESVSDVREGKTVPQTTECPSIGAAEDKLNSRSQVYSEPTVKSSESPATPVMVPGISPHNQTASQPCGTYSPAVATAVTSENCKLNQSKLAEHSSGFQSVKLSNSEFRNTSFPESIPADNSHFSAPTETIPSSSSMYRENKPANTLSEFESPNHNGNISQGSLEQFPQPPGHRLADNRCASFDERNYYAEKDRSRPSSRMSLHGTADEHSYHERDYRRQCPPYYDRVPSRMSESEAMRASRHGRYPYYEQPYYDDRYASYHRDDDYYNRARNYKGFEYDPYRQDRHPYYAYYDPYRYGYSSYNYGFYDELYRNDPRYKQQMEERYKQQMEERYRQYYAKLGYETDQERSSVHSGRSSANELAKEMPARYAEPDGDSNESEYSAYNQQYYGYDEYSSKPSSADLSAEQITATSAARLTPAKFSCAHPICSFSSSGVLVTVIPTQPGSMQVAPVEFHNIQVLMEDTESFEELKQYQGPLIRGKTHKNDIIEFCLQKVKYFAAKKDLPDRESYILLWELMVLLLRQNGSVAGSDIAELLLKDHEVLRPASLISKPNVETPQGDGALPDVGEHSNQVASGDTSSPDEGIVVSHDKSILNPAASIDVDNVTRKFREFLLFGHKKDALEWAMKHGLWGHALFLASKMDLRTYANVMTRFANSLALNDPLQTLYQLMSGRQPAAVTCVGDKKWGDWRPHLAMILSNPSSHTEVDLRSITTLGDTLANNGCLPAAHFCYLMAQVEFGMYSRKSSKMVLLSSNHLLPFQEFATNEAIQCTEIYEYAQSLANPGFLLPHLQAYKFIYATRLAEHGFLQEALHYCEIISNNFQQNTDLFSIGFVDEVLELATKLKFHDPVFIQGQGEWEDQNDPDWLQNLTFLLQNYKDGAVQIFGDYGNAVPNLPSESNVPEYISGSAADFGTNQIASDGDTQNQSCYSQPPVQQNFYQQNNWVTQESTQLPEQESHADIVSHQETTQYQNDMTSQWNVSSEQPSTFEDLEKSTEQVSFPVSSQGNTSFDYYGTSIQQEWSYSLPPSSVSPPGAAHHINEKLEDFKTYVLKDDTESDTALCSSAQSTPLHNYLLSKSNSEDTKMLVSHHGKTDSGMLNSCLKSSKNLSKSKKSIKFDSTASQQSGDMQNKNKLHQAVMRRRKMMTRKPSNCGGTTDSSAECSPSREKLKNNTKLSILSALGLNRSTEESKTKLIKRKRKNKKKLDANEKILQSRKTFAIDEPFDSDDSKWNKDEKSVDETISETKKMIALLTKLSNEEKKNTELCNLMAAEFKKKPPLIFGGTFPIDEPCEIESGKSSIPKMEKSFLPYPVETCTTQSLIKPISAIKKPIFMAYSAENSCSESNASVDADDYVLEKSQRLHKITQSGEEKIGKSPKSSPFKVLQRLRSHKKPAGKDVEFENHSKFSPNKVEIKSSPSKGILKNSPVKSMMKSSPNKNIMKSSPNKNIMKSSPNKDIMKSPSKSILKSSPSKGIMKSAKTLIKEYSEHVSRQTSRERTNSSSSVGTVVDRRSSTLSTGSGYGVRSPPAATRSAKEESQRVEKKEEKPKSQAGRAWLGGIFSKWIPRAPNQMILPDDKNPTIIWDSTKNCWINTDSNEEDEINKPAAPPTDTELMGNKTSPDLPHSPPQPPASSTSVINRFQRPKTKGMRQNYVDILNPSGTANKPIPASEALFPPPPPPPQSQTSASKFFVPSVPAASEDQPVDFVSTSYSPFNASSSLENEDGCASGSPLMFDPAEFESRKSSISSLRHSVGPAGRRTYPT